MPDLPAFLQARLDEHEAAIFALPPEAQRPWGASENLIGTLQWVGVFAPNPTGRGGAYDIGRMPSRPVAEFIAANHPPRVLAEIAAKRRHLEIWRESLDQMSDARRKGAAATDEMSRAGSVQQYERALGTFDTICKVLNLDVATYASHAEFDETWSLDA
jgi:hypothetical protein